jgi:hypothetical protein
MTLLKNSEICHVSVAILLLQKGTRFIAPTSRGSIVNFIAAECKKASLKYAWNMKLIKLPRNIFYPLPCIFPCYIPSA